MPLSNVESVLEHGILSYKLASKLPHRSVAMQPVQDRRDKKQVPLGLKLHEYANLYFDARNPMMYKRRQQAAQLCVLRISRTVLDIEGTVITDCNASSDYVRFLAPRQWKLLDFDDIYAEDWRHPGDPPRFYQHRSRKCAEVLVPHTVPHNFIEGAYVMNGVVDKKLRTIGFAKPIMAAPKVFFQ